VAPEHLAYVIYTSGSTGKPKGAGNRHKALTNRLCWMQQAYGLGVGDTALQKTPFSFDVSVWEFFWPLMTGARLAVAGPGDHRDPRRLVELINEYQVSTLHFVPSMLQMFLLDEQVSSCTSLRRIVCSGEALPVDAQDQVLARLPNAGLYNLYGPTEAAIDVTHWTCRDEGRDAVPIGQPIANLQTYVLDAELQPVPAGVVGELYLGGEGLARGYHRRPALTAERFVTSPFGEGQRLYRTGDLASQRADGVIEYRGRIDHQVKIRGLRIELGEIEARLMEQDAVRDAVVLAIDGALIGYVVPSEWQPEAQESLRETIREPLRQALPDYMVPSQLLFIERMPLSPNGKLERKALPKPDASQAQKAYVAPRTELEQRIATIWQDVLKLERVGLNDNFFELGGDSIISIQVVSRARQAGIRFTPKDLFQHQTVRDLAHIAHLDDSAPLLEHAPASGEAPLLPIQRRFFAEIDQQRHHWNQSVLLKPNRPVDAEALAQALQALVQHHDALRLVFTEQAGDWTAHFLDTPTVPVLEQRQATYANLRELANDTQRSLDLANGPLLRAVLITLEDHSQRLLLVIHHLVVDGVSWRILFDDLQTAYTQAASGEALRLPARTTSVKAWAERLEQYVASPSMQEELAYWQAQLDGLVTDLPADHPQGSLSNQHAQALQVRLDRTTTRRLLQDAPQAYRTQINDLLLTALARAVARWTGQPEVAVQLEGHGREALFDELDLTRTVGWFTSLFPVRLGTQDDLGANLRVIKETLRGVPAKGVGYSLLRELGQGLRDLPEPRITFNYLGQFDTSFAASEDALFIPASEGSGEEQSRDARMGNWLTLNGQVYDGELSLSWLFSTELFDSATVQALADDYLRELHALIEHCCNPGNRGVTPSDFPLARVTQAQLQALPLAAGQVEDLYPLSPMQQGMLFHTLEAAEAGLYINQMAVDVEGLDIERFRAAWDTVIARHDILRTGFWSDNQLAEPLQVVQRHAQMPLTVLDWRDRAVDAADLSQLAAQDYTQGFDLLRAPLMRLTLVRLDEQRAHLLWSGHHILVDGWSNSRLLGEVLQAYHGHPAPASGGRYRDYIQWLARQPQDALEGFWREQLRSFDSPTHLASTLGPRPDASLEGHAALYLDWDAAHTAQLREQARTLRVTPNTLIQAAWLLLLQRYTGQASVCFGATVAGRPASLPGADEMLGLFINTLPVIQQPQPTQSLQQWLLKLQASNLDIRDYEHASLADIQRWAGLGGQAMFDSIIVFENYPVDERLQQAEEGQLRFGQVQGRDVTNFAMDLAVNLGNTLSIEFLYLRNRFSEAAVAQVKASFETLLQAMLEQPDACLGSLSLLDAAQGQRLCLDNAIRPASGQEPLLVEQLRQQALARPQAIAVTCNEQQLTWAELEDQANRLANHLIAQGVALETRVGVALERSVQMIVAFYAVMKAGAAYVPLDIDYPQERLKWIVEDSGMALMITQASLQARFDWPNAAPQVLLDTLALDDLPADCPPLRALGDNLAYLIYTSGSTGKPKGVAVANEPIRMHCAAIAERYGMTRDTRELLFMSFAFDGAQERWLTTLSCGGQLVLRDNQLWTPEQTWHALHRHAISVACFPPAYLQQLAEFAQTQEQAPPPVSIYCFGGDAVAEANFERVKQALRPQWLTNGYGPTETVVTPLLWKIAADGACDAVYAPIGTRVGERTLYVLDDALNPLPPGVAGELYIGGQGLARGYHQRPGLSAERFVADPFSAGGRLYRTGDLVRQREDGVFDYLGRLDNQVKIRGFRIELGEIEARLRDLPGVQDAVVVAREHGGGKQLVGYVVADIPSGEPLRAALLEALPDYMVPAQVVVLDALPLNPNGKVDRNALPDPQFKGRTFVAPRNALEQALAAIWQEVLEVEQVGVTDNFFELGGDSLRVLKVLSKVRGMPELGLQLKLRDLMGKPTIAELSGHVPEKRSMDPLVALNAAAPDGTALFCVHAGFGTVFDYEALARRLEGRYSVYGLQCRMLLDDAWEDESLEAMALDYAQYIRQKQPQGPYHLLGWSLGGPLVSLVAQELLRQGQRVAFAALVDSFVPQAQALDAAPEDCADDLRGLLSVVLGVPLQSVPALVVTASDDLARLEQVIDQARQALSMAQGALSEMPSDELARTFRTGMKLKALSLQLSAMAQCPPNSHCWWAGQANDLSDPAFDNCVQHAPIAADHYAILRHPAFLDSLLRHLPLAEAVTP
ncbi:amino acid adenylation domain-containing protein, partial [Pseudomonas sp. NPDC089554]|uniref:amino acid adenylation domain-containing protein n=1 Tax=Pseudomonas sp. NPDC089554 TaxID=3390653 RepID=UPI003CFF4CE9